jgi:hypothetical protein
MSLLTTASLVITPNAGDEGTLYSVIPSDGSGDMSVVRATTATRVNSAGLVELVPYNLVTWSEQIDNADWLKSNSPTITTNIAIAPNGTMTADGIQSPSGTNYKVIYQTKTIAPNSTLTYSLYVKKETSETNFGGIGMYLSGGSIKSFYVIINAVTGTLVLTANSITPTLQVVDAGAYWRIITTVIDDGNNTSVIAEYYATISTNGTSLAPASGSVRTLWGFQLNEGTLKPYQKTETRLNIPRLDYSNGTCPSLLVEPQRTNIFTYSEQFDNLSWNKQNCTITANTLTSPSGILNADSLIASSGTSSAVGLYILELTSAPKNFSFFAKKGNKDWAVLLGYNGNNNVWFNVANGTIGTIGSNFINAQIEDFGNGWYRCSATLNSSVAILPNIGLYVSNSDNSLSCTGDGTTTSIYLWGAQLEAGSYPTSYIPTTSASVTRNADVVSKTGISSLIGQTEGTMFYDGYFGNNNSEVYLFLQKSGSTIVDDSMYIQKQFGNQIRFNSFLSSTNQVAITGGSFSIGDRIKIAASYKNNDFVMYINGVQIGTDTSATPPTCANLHLATFAGDPTNEVYIANKGVNASALWKTRLTNTQLQTLTSI